MSTRRNERIDAKTTAKTEASASGPPRGKTAKTEASASGPPQGKICRDGGERKRTTMRQTGRKRTRAKALEAYDQHPHGGRRKPLAEVLKNADLGG